MSWEETPAICAEAVAPWPWPPPGVGGGGGCDGWTTTGGENAVPSGSASGGGGPGAILTGTFVAAAFTAAPLAFASFGASCSAANASRCESR